MEDEIDLKPYIRAILSRWWIILSAAVGLAVIVGMVAITRTSPYTASASLLITPATTQVTLDSRFTSRDSMLLTTTVNQREALLELARDPVLEARVAQTLEMTYTPNSLINRISVHTNGDLIRITASGKTSDEAQQLVMVWAQEYVQLVTEVYNREVVSIESIEKQLNEARQRYQEAQTALEAFLAQGELAAADQEVRRLNDLLNNARAAGTNRFNDYLRRSNSLEQIIRDARLLRERLDSQKADEINTADAIAALLLRIRNLSDQGSERPILQLDSSLTNNATITRAELDYLIAALEDEYLAVRSEVEHLSEVSPEELSPAVNKLLLERLAIAQTRLEQLSARQRELTRNRDIAFSTIELLLRRADELRLANVAPQVSVRYLGTVANPSSLIGRQTMIQAAIAALAGIVLSMAVVVVVEAIAIARRNSALQPKPTGD